MSMHVTMIGNSLNVRCRMMLSDLDQIKKNERDRRRRLRVEQVREQSKEISNRILERARKIKRDELSKLEKDGKSELRQMHDRKIMDIQNKYQEDLVDIGQAHACAALQPDVNVIIEEEGKKDRAMALKRGKEAMERMKEAKQTDDAEAVHQERLRKVREIENVRAAMVSKIPKPFLSEEKKKSVNPSQNVNKEIVQKVTPQNKNKKVLPKKSPEKVKKPDVKENERTVSPKPGPSGLQKKAAVQSHESISRKKADKQVADHNGHNIDDASDDQVPRKTVPVMSTMPTRTDKADTTKIYNPKDYTQDASSSVSSSSSDSTSDDSSYFSDTIEQITFKKTPRTPVSTKHKVRSQCDCNIHLKHVCDRPLGTVQRIDIRNEPNAMEVARAMRHFENVEARLLKNHKLNVERRSEDALLREKVRKGYQALLKNIDHSAQEKRKLKASQTCCTEENPCMRLNQRIKSQEDRQKKMNRAVKRIFCTDGASTRCVPVTKRVVTSPTWKKSCVRDDVPDSTCHNAHLIKEQVDVCGTQQDKESEMSREEQILDMLKNVERQKRLLLQEFGASLPDNIFNVSTKSLFEGKMPTKEHETNTAKPLSPEIKVINMSSSDECVKQDPKMKTLSKSPAKKIEIAVQTALEQIGPVENKGVQVELSQDDMHIQHADKDVIERPPHPIEPKVTIITPEIDDSSNNSSNSESNGMIIEIDKEEVIVTPKKRKSSVRASKRLSPRIYQKIRLTSVGSKGTSPVKKFLRTQSSSRLTQKKMKCFDAPDTVKRVDVHMSESTQIDDDSDPSQETRVSIDASAESSQTYLGVNDQDQALGKPYRVQRRKKEWIRVRDTSDTSTSFASPPPIKSKSVFDALTNVTSILEMLEFSDPGLEKLRRIQEISPVSTPETPSPRTMMMPSNIPHRDRISRMLKFNNSNSEINDSNVMSSTQKDQSTLTNQSDIYQKSEAGMSKHTATTSRQSSFESCICRNPHCKLLHIKFNNIHDYALKNCPEILQKYEELQNLCSERIASLSHLIERVRNDQTDINFSLSNDDTSLMQTSAPGRNNAQEIRKLIDSIEGFYAQLTRTLLESQRIMRGNETSSRNKTSYDAGIQAITSTPRSKLVDSVKTHIQKSKLVEDKPKIISNEKVNIQLNRFKMQQKPQPTATTKTFERSFSPPCTLPLHEKDIIDKLSKEILEQSKNLDKARTAFAALKNDETQHKVSFKELDLKRSTSLECEKDSSTTKELTSTPEKATERENYTPTLTGIPKILRNHGNGTLISTRPKPPVTLLNGLYRPELESTGHELSTIVEFDTTDTVNKSSKSPAKSKPSVHVAPLPVQQNQNSSKKSVDLSLGMKHFEKLSFAQKSQEATTICNSPEKLKSNADCITGTEIEAERDCMLEKCSTQLQGNTTTEECISQTKEKLDSSTSTDFNNVHKESKQKTTSTSLYSFSGISGISEIISSPSLEILKHNSPGEDMEIALKKYGMDWAVTTLKKTREASALSSSSNSDVTPINTARRMISPTKKQHDSNGFPDISDVSSISIKEASKSTEQAVLLKGRTSTPKFENSNSNSERSTTNTSESVQERSDSLTVPNVSLTKTKSDNKQLQSP